MNIFSPPIPDDGFIHFDTTKVEIATIPADYYIQLTTGAISILDVKIVNGEFRAPGIIFPNGLKFANVIDHDKENKALILSI